MEAFLTAVWGTGVRKMLSTLTLIAGLVVAVPQATAVVYEWQPVAFKTFVLAAIQSKIDPMLQVESKLLLAQAQQQQTLNQIYLSQLQSSLYAAQQDMDKSPSHTVQERIDQIKQQIQDLQTKTGGSR